MTRTPITIALSFLLAAGAASAFAAEGEMKQATPSSETKSHSYGSEHMKSNKSAAMSADQKDLAVNHGETGRGEGSGVTTMSNRGEMAAESKESQRAAKPVPKEPLGETGRGQGSGPTMTNRPEMAADKRVDAKTGADSSSTTK